MSLRTLYNNRVNVEQVTRTADDMGGWTESWAVLHRNLKCRIWQVKGDEQKKFNKNTVTSSHRMVCPYKSDITEAMRVVDGSVTYNILFVSDWDSANDHLEIDLEKVI